MILKKTIHTAACRSPFGSDMPRLVITGPESTGKSDLTRWLAEALRLPMALEYARIYLEEREPGYRYAFEDLLTMSRGHLRYQQERVPLDVVRGIFDTDLINYRIWCDVVYGRCHDEIHAAMERETSHVYLVCAPDIPWEPDPLRTNPHDREMLFDLHVHWIDRLNRPCRIVTGQDDARRQHALELAQELLEME